MNHGYKISSKGIKKDRRQKESLVKRQKDRKFTENLNDFMKTIEGWQI